MMLRLGRFRRDYREYSLHQRVSGVRAAERLLERQLKLQAKRYLRMASIFEVIAEDEEDFE
jgi:hypothetical protein